MCVCILFSLVRLVWFFIFLLRRILYSVHCNGFFHFDLSPFLVCSPNKMQHFLFHSKNDNIYLLISSFLEMKSLRWMLKAIGLRLLPLPLANSMRWVSLINPNRTNYKSRTFLEVLRNVFFKILKTLFHFTMASNGNFSQNSALYFIGLNLSLLDLFVKI